ncbi:MAG: hypothetical protein EAZ97_04425 [Bacteroidetes bacterium]|nr:MAG: hypothetical protein EAZ97_04425 [Bacteroidota bacterium]
MKTFCKSKASLLLFFCLFATTFAFAQGSIPELKTRLNKENDRANKVDIAFKIANSYTEQENLEEARRYYGIVSEQGKVTISALQKSLPSSLNSRDKNKIKEKIFLVNNRVRQADQLLVSLRNIAGNSKKNGGNKNSSVSWSAFKALRKKLDEQKDLIENQQEDLAIMDSTINYQDLVMERQKSELQQQEIELLRKEREKDKQERELEHANDLLRQNDLEQQRYLIGLVAMAALLGLAVFAFVRIRNAKKEIELEKGKSDALLLNILPKSTAEELKKNGRAKPKSYEMVTVLFTDFKGFTQVAAKLTPEEVVKELDKCFGGFDEIISRHGLEKIKTIGDSYMCAGGIPMENQTNPFDAINAALEMAEFIEKWKAEQIAKNEPFFDIRIGLHTGKIVAGVVGSKKFAYDIWGDAVNLASRMESSGEPGKVNISGETYEIVKEKYVCTPRGKVYAKNKGDVEMYFVESKKL